MSHSVDECYDVYSEQRVTARKAHACDACREPIAAASTYWRIAIVFDGEAETVKRCERCQKIHMHLRSLDPGASWPAEKLDCGIAYRDHWEFDPPDEIAALAFALPGDAALEAK